GLAKGPAAAGPFGDDGLLGAAAEVLEALVELLDAAGRVEDALLARVERVRRRGDLHVDDGVLDAVELDRLVAGDRGAGQEGLARAEVAEDDRVVVGVDVGLHGDPRGSRVLDSARTAKSAVRAHQRTILPARRRGQERARAAKRPSCSLRVMGRPNVSVRFSAVSASAMGPAATTPPSRSSRTCVNPTGISSTWCVTMTMAGVVGA